MNTPKPCHECEHLRYGTLYEDGWLVGSVDCYLGGTIGDVSCRMFDKWEHTSPLVQIGTQKRFNETMEKE